MLSLLIENYQKDRQNYLILNNNIHDSNSVSVSMLNEIPALDEPQLETSHLVEFD